MAQQIRIKIGINGVIEAETLGIKGKNCLKYLERIEKMANATTIDSKFTDEYYENGNNLDINQSMEVRDNVR